MTGAGSGACLSSLVAISRSEVGVFIGFMRGQSTKSAPADGTSAIRAISSVEAHANRRRTHCYTALFSSLEPNRMAMERLKIPSPWSGDARTLRESANLRPESRLKVIPRSCGLRGTCTPPRLSRVTPQAPSGAENLSKPPINERQFSNCKPHLDPKSSPNRHMTTLHQTWTPSFWSLSPRLKPISTP